MEIRILWNCVFFRLFFVICFLVIFKKHLNFFRSFEATFNRFRKIRCLKDTIKHWLQWGCIWFHCFADASITGIVQFIQKSDISYLCAVMFLKCLNHKGAGKSFVDTFLFTLNKYDKQISRPPYPRSRRNLTKSSKKCKLAHPHRLVFSVVIGGHL